MTSTDYPHWTLITFQAKKILFFLVPQQNILSQRAVYSGRTRPKSTFSFNTLGWVLGFNVRRSVIGAHVEQAIYYLIFNTCHVDEIPTCRHSENEIKISSYSASVRIYKSKWCSYLRLTLIRSFQHIFYIWTYNNSSNFCSASWHDTCLTRMIEWVDKIDFLAQNRQLGLAIWFSSA